ncbi:ABC transporter ATP-binding protein [Tissierella sp.]|uniref:ABC transporter ATP-binding protein n=1 Tax=Tissierella sp. TaxID=41274 RepID=UPI00286096EC|nr:ABC transporter ATP-binding protein [Tissierella sp.]MDR7856808.1 ABC transporter ATP-binding protein [Tissierella sp.]
MKTKLKSLPQFLKEMSRDYKYMLPLIFTLAIFQGLSPLINIILPKYILDELLESKRINILLLYIGGLAIGNFLFQLVISICRNHLNIYNNTLALDSVKKLGMKATNIDLQDSEKKSNLDLLERGKQGTYNIIGFTDNISILGASLITIITVLGILIKNDWRLILLILLCNIITIPCFSKIKELDIDNAKRGIPENRAFRYLCSVATDFRFAKDLRIYKGDKFFIKKAEDTMDKILSINHEYFTKHGLWNGLAQSIVQIQLTLTFIILGLSLFAARITVGTFTMLYSASNQLSRSFNSLIQAYTNLVTLSFNLDPYYEFLNIEETGKEGEKFNNAIDRPVSLTFEDITFKYPTAEEDILKNVNFQIYPGETLAIVGKNGAGKTTIIKLLCRLYKPQKGRILINGIDIHDLPIEEYKKQLSIVFQDFKLLPIKLDENILGKEERLITVKETETVWEKLEETGIKSWIDNQSKGLKSYLTKTFDNKGLVLSGGQEQKIAISRALARDGGIVILDEPTAALDPKSEEEVFENLIKLTDGKTSIFISHRLSSTRIADRIIVLDKGEILEEGNHKELIERDGLYANMYNIQAKQYIS